MKNSGGNNPGGSATHAGIRFQDQIAGLLSIHILADAPVDFFGLPSGITPVSIELETSAPVDDVLVSTSAGGYCFVNVKKGVSTSTKRDSPLASVIDQFVRLWITCQSGNSMRSWQRPLDSSRDRVILVTGGKRSATFVVSLAKILSRIYDRASVARDAVTNTKSECNVYDSVFELLRTAFRRHSGTDGSDDALASLLRLTRVVFLDPDGRDKASSLMLLKNAVVADAADAERAWGELVLMCQRLAEDRSGADRAGIRNALISRGVRLQGAPEIAKDVQQLEEMTTETLASLAHLAYLKVPTCIGTERIEIQRAVTAALVEYARQTSILVIGEPGSGKSGALYSAAKKLLDEGYPVVAIAVDRHPVATPDEMRRDLRLERPLIDILRTWIIDKPGILFIDALDATRGGPSDRVFHELIREVLDHAPNWHVVASIRVFDLRFGVTYRELFAGSPIHSLYQDSEFSSVRHLSIPLLTDPELDQVWSHSPPMRDAYREGTTALRELLRSPFNLFLLSNVLVSEWRGLRDVTTQLQLLHRYWSHRVIGADQKGFSRESLLRKAVEQMLDAGTLQVALQSVPNPNSEDINWLLSEGVLAQAERTRDRVSRISFAHHMLFDYAVARLILEEGQASDFIAHLTRSDQRELLIAPGAIMALQALWQEDEARRQSFWRKAFEIASSDAIGSFCRMLPARVAAALVEETTDFELVLKCLRQPDCPNREAAKFLVRHCSGALSAGIRPISTSASPLGAWPSITQALADAAVADVGWILKPLIAQWVEHPDRLSPSEEKSVNATAIRMLRHGSGFPYDPSMVMVGIQGVARTFGTAPDDSADVLCGLLSPDHVKEYGHKELSWIAYEMDHLLKHTPLSCELIRKMYRAAYCTPLPSRDEITYLGNSRILSLTSNRRQDFEHAQWELFQKYPPFFEASPDAATETLIEILDCYTDLHQEVDKAQPVAFSFGNQTAAYLPDHACLRFHDDYKAPPILAFQSGITSLVNANRFDVLDRVLGIIVRKNRLASIWAALLRAGAIQPEQLGRRLLPLVTAIPVLDGWDTRKPAGDLVKVVHPMLSPEDRAAIERAILETNDYTQAVLLGCLDEKAIVSERALSRRRELEAQRPLPANREPIENTVRWGDPDDDWWLREKGVDLSTEANAELNNVIKRVEKIRKRAKEAPQGSRLALVEGWPKVQSLHTLVQSGQDFPEALLMSAWNAIAEAAEAAAECSESPNDLALFAGIKEMIVGALRPILWPRPVADSKRETEFAKMPSWGSPAPRIEAAGALMALARAEGAPRADLEELIQNLSRDPSPEVRHQILGRTNMLFDANQPLMWKLCATGFSEEMNEGVLSFFISAVERVVRRKPDWFAEQLLALDSRKRDEPSDNHRDEFLAHIVHLLLRLWFAYDQQSAGQRIREWIADPMRHPKSIQAALHMLRDTMLQGDPDNPDSLDDRVRARTVEIFESTVTKLMPIFKKRAEEGWQDLSPEDSAGAETLLRILDAAAAEIYFGSGAHSGKNSNNQENPFAGRADVRARFLKEMHPTLVALAQVPYPSVTHHLLRTLEEFVPDDPPLIFRIVTDALISGGRSGGYQYESLGSELFVRIVRRYLADFRSVLASDDDLRHRLINALDIFVEAGWPEARRLVYDLPEMLR